MILKGTEVKTIEDAFSLLAPEEQAHALRVSAYTDAAFARAAARDLYISEVRGKTELVRENRSFAKEAGKYHDIGKLAEGMALPEDFAATLDLEAEDAEPGAGTQDFGEADHTAWGAYLIRELYPKFRSQKTYHQRMLLDGARDHHERMNGTGTPLGKEGKQVGYLGRLVAIADELDHRAMVKRSEDPIGDVLKEMKAEAADGRFDMNFLKCFSGSAVSLRKTFDAYRGETQAVPQAEAWIRRRSSRPMELRYSECKSRPDGETVWLAEMRFRDAKDELRPYAEMKQLINSRKLGPKLGDYFLYELCDTLRRFEVCGVKGGKAAIELPESWYSRRSLAKAIAQILSDEGITAERIFLLLPASLSEKSSKTLDANRAECEAAGFPFHTAETLLEPERGPMRSEDDIALGAIAAGSEAST